MVSAMEACARCRANPKSAIFRVASRPGPVSSRFCGLRSLWTRCFDHRKWSPEPEAENTKNEKKHKKKKKRGGREGQSGRVTTDSPPGTTFSRAGRMPLAFVEYLLKEAEAAGRG